MRVSRTKRHAGREATKLAHRRAESSGRRQPETVSEKLGSGEGDEKERQGQAWPGKARQSQAREQPTWVL